MRSSWTVALGLACILGPLGACSSDEAPTPETDEPEATLDEYQTSGTCAGLPRLPLETPAGVCVGLVASGLKFPRGIAQLPNGDLILADMGGWALNKGSVWLFARGANGTYAKRQILSQIDKPSGIAVGPDNLVYVATPADIFRFDPYETGRPQPRLKLVVRNLLGGEGARHPLHHLAFDPKNPWQLYVNIGSDSDMCESEQFAAPCNEAERAAPRGAIYHYDLSAGDHLATGFTVAARGLRNSMALAFHPGSGTLLQGENARDSIDKRDPSLRDLEGELPHEELNVIEPGAHYGWPYCYDNGVASPEYPGYDCSSTKTPAMLLPGHVAPLGMEYYQGDLFPPAYRGNLIVGFHGYRANGHRIVMVPVDDRGVPNGEVRDLVRGWEKTATQPQGAPVDVLVGQDGSIFVTEDKNGTILKLSFDASAGAGTPLVPKPPVTPVMTTEERVRCEALATKSGTLASLQRDVLDAACVSCHGAGPGYAGGLALLRCDDVGNATRLRENRRTGGPLVKPNDEDSELVKRLEGDGFPQMPAGGISPEQMAEVLAWIRAGAPTR